MNPLSTLFGLFKKRPEPTEQDKRWLEGYNACEKGKEGSVSFLNFLLARQHDVVGQHTEQHLLLSPLRRARTQCRTQVALQHAVNRFALRTLRIMLLIGFAGE